MINKYINKVIILAVFLIAVSINSYAATGTINGDTIRLRKEPNTESTVIDIYDNGKEVEVIEKDGEWYKVTIDKKTGYIYGEYISVEQKEDEEKEKTEQKQEKKEETKTEKENTKNEKKENNNIKLGKVKSATTQKIYILPNIGSSILGEVKQDEDVNIIREVNGWAYIATDDLYGWSRYEKIANQEERDKISNYENEDEKDKEEKDSSDKKKEEVDKKEEKTEDKKDNDIKETQDINVTEKEAYISVAGVNFREGPDTSANVIKGLDVNTKITIFAENGDWYKVKINDVIGYVSKDYISNSKIEVPTSRATEKERKIKKTTSGKTTGQDVADYAKQYLGYNYVYGAESPSTGFDCSGLVWYVYKQFGYNISRTAATQACDGRNIANKSDLKPGDILIFKDYMNYSVIGHVGIYIGNNEFIHANDESTGVIITSLDYGKYPERFISGRRIVD